MPAQFDSSKMAGLILGGLFVLAWLSVMGSFLYFRFRVAPAAVLRWAIEEEYRIIRRRNARAFDDIFNRAGTGVQLFRVIVRDHSGRVREALVQVGEPYWFCLSSDRCPVEVLRWREADPTLGAKSKSGRGALWDADLDA